MKCKHPDCFYSRRVIGMADPTCDYCLIEKESRKCPADDCNKYKPKVGRVRSQIAYGEALKEAKKC